MQMLSRVKRKFIFAGGIGILIIIFIGVGVFRPQKSLTSYVLLEKEKTVVSSNMPMIGGDFTLKDLKDRVWTQQDLLGKYSLIYFGYSYCPDICPTALYNMSHALKKLDARKVIPIFITIDPLRDTTQQLQIYRQNFHPSFVFLSGTEDQVKKVIKNYRVHAARVEEGRGEDYLMDHSSIIYLMDPKGHFIKHFNHQTPVEDLVKEIQIIID